MNGQIQIKLMKTNFIFLFLCVCLCAVQNGLWAQGWERSYPLNHSQISNAIDFLPSGNLLLVGTWGDLSGAGASDLGYQYLVVSPDGQLVRHYTYAYPDLVGLPAFITSDGSVLHTENVHQSPNAGWGSELFKIDGQGQREWAFRTPYGEPLFSVTELNNGRYLLPTVRDTLINGQAAQRIGLYCFSTDGQVVATANRFCQGKTGLVLLTVDPSRLKPELRYEDTLNHGTFPHLYGPLNVDAVVDVRTFEPGADGTFSM